jgi:hypothetical protein
MNDANPPSPVRIEAKQSEPEDLWPKKMHRSTLKAPVAILREQASILGERTRNVVTAEVRPYRSQQSTKLFFAFNLVAPALNNYSLSLFTISHEPTQIYPVEVKSDIITAPGTYESKWSAESEGAFKAVLKTIFSDNKTITAIQSLMAQSESGTFGFEREEDVPF